MLPKNLTKKQVKEAIEYINKWDKKVVELHGYFFKRINKNEVEIFTKDENEFWTYKLKPKQTNQMML